MGDASISGMAGEAVTAYTTPDPIPVLAIVGATAVGKTALAVRLAERCGGEIVSADSRQIYRWMDIGTGKPTAEERARARHHALDLVAPDQTLSLSEYQAVAAAAIADIHQRGRLPLVVGGTGQYVTALLEGWSAPPVSPNPALRAELEAELARAGTAALFARLHAIDPDAAAAIDRHNPRRLIRALEVCITTGAPFRAQQGRTPPPYRPLLIGLTRPRPALFAAADARLDAMLAAGFADEVRDLLARGFAPTLPAMSGIGYRQLAAHILGSASWADAVAETRTATHRFIRRQETWFRNQHSESSPIPVVWLPAEGAFEAASGLIDGWRNRPPAEERGS